MRIWIGKVLPVLALSIAMSEAGAASEQVMGASDNTPQPPIMAVNEVEASRSQSAGLGLRVALQYGLTGASAVRSVLLAPEIRPVPPVGAAKTSALVLSSLGMLSLISLLRLNRAL